MPNECNDLFPSLCGGSRLPIMKDTSCYHVQLTGITDVTIWQDETLDLTDGVHAYDGNGNEIAYTYNPTSIDTSVPGEYVVRYTASGVGNAIKPNMCIEWALQITDCGNEVVTKNRKIKVLDRDAIACEAVVCESVTVCAPTPDEAIICQAIICESTISC